MITWNSLTIDTVFPSFSSSSFASLSDVLYYFKGYVAISKMKRNGLWWQFGGIQVHDALAQAE